MSPFYVVYGRLPPPMVEYEGEQTTNAMVHEELTQRTHILKELHANLKEAQNRTKQTADKARRGVQFKVGDKVLIRLQPYRQTSVAHNTFSKLRRRFFGPYEILKKVGLVAYKVALPPNARIHNVLHVSKLKAFKENSELHPQTIPQEVIEGRIVIQPLEIRRQRWIVGRQHNQLQVLVRWKGLGPEEDSWMTMEDFKLAYPSFDLEDKVIAEEGSNVTAQVPFYTRTKKKENRPTVAMQEYQIQHYKGAVYSAEMLNSAVHGSANEPGLNPGEILDSI